uniref:Uncharacterized protein n=1 Tax=Hyaloperonospora arabidopsidis (strain Emoy2) TaxID=559515 RepID=M4C3H1_HYAAE
MIADAEQNEEAKIASRTIHNFPDECRGEQKENLMKASRWCKDRDSTTTSLSNKRRKSGTTKAINSVCQRGSRRLLEKKAMDGRGRKRQSWVTWLYAELVVEFDRLHKAGLKFSPMVLRIVAKTILRTSQGELHSAFRDLLNGNTLDERITPRWIQYF